jgi:hypothetical protein
MEIADVKRQVMAAIERARRQADQRRTRQTEAARAYATFLDRTAVPLLRQIANVLRAEGFAFSVFTPAGSVRLTSDRAAEDYLEIALDTSGPHPAVLVHSSRGRGRRVLESERPIGAPEDVDDAGLLAAVLEELEPLVER